MTLLAHWLGDAVHDVRHALRSFRQRPGFAAITLLILALGIGATTIMFTVVDGVLLRPLPFLEPDRLLTVRRVVAGFGEVWGFSYPDLTDLNNATRTVTTAAWTYSGGTITSSGSTEYVDGRLISADLFSVLGVPLEHGRAFRAEEDRPGAPPVAIISDGFWQRHFAGSPSAVGMPLQYDGKIYTVVGIAPRSVQLDGDADVLTPLGQSTEPRMHNRGANFIHVWARLRAGVAPAVAEAELAVVGRQLAEQYPATDAGVALRAHALRQELVGDVRETLWLLLAGVGLVLLIACANIASLLLARAVSRDREMAMRMALGASRRRLVRQCLTEGAVLGLVGGLLGVVLSTVGVRPFIVSWPGSLPGAGDIGIDWPVLVFALAVSLGSGLLSALAPALRVSQRHLMRRGTRRLHGVFVISEIATAVVLLVSAGMLGRTLMALSSLDPGVTIHDVLTARLALSAAATADSTTIRVAWRAALDRARHVSGVEAVALADIIPMREGENSLSYSTTASPPPPDQTPVALASAVTPDYRRVMGIPLRTGRFLDEHDSAGHEPVVVIDEHLARRAFGGADAVGKRLWIQSLGDAPVRIVGVVGHVRHWGLAADDRSPVRDQLYYPLAQVPAPLLHFFSSVMSIAVRTTIPPLTAVGPLRVAVGDGALYDVRTMEQLVRASLDRQRFLLVLFGVFAGVAVLLACSGIYGVLSYLTNQRVPEIGLRMALGADASTVMRSVLRESLIMIVVGAGIGLCGALAAGRVLNHLVLGMRPSEPLTVATMIGVLVAAALVASALPARWASRLDPVRALRQG